MNENPEGTPNPLEKELNDAQEEGILDANPAEPIQEDSSSNNEESTDDKSMDDDDTIDVFANESKTESDKNESVDETDSDDTTLKLHEDPKNTTFAFQKEVHNDTDTTDVDSSFEESETIEKRDQGTLSGYRQTTTESMRPGSQPADFVTGGAYRNHNVEQTNANNVKYDTSISVGSLDPTGRTMQKTVEIVEPPKQNNKKKWILFTVIGCICLVIGIGAAIAAIMLTAKKPDPVGDAMQKIMRGEAPENVVIDGDINILMNDSSLPIKRVNIDLDSNVVFASMINTSSAILTLTDQTDNDYSAKIDEVYAANGDLYFRIEGVSTLLDNMNLLSLFTGPVTTTTPEDNCVDSPNGEVNCTPEPVDCVSEDGTDCAMPNNVETQTDADATHGLSGEELYSDGGVATLLTTMKDSLMSVFQSADGVWIRISTDALNLTDETGGGNPSSISCITNLVKDVNKNSNSAFETYNKYPFVVSSNKGILISSKRNPVYQISLDSKNFNEYINAIKNTELSSTLYSCMGWNNNVVVTESDVDKIVSKMPKIYAEVNYDNDFTRLYLESDINDGAANAIIDLNFSYPTNVNVSEPVEYTNYEDFIKNVFSGIFNFDAQSSGVTTDTTTPEAVTPQP